MNILFVWTGITSYMPDCWRALADNPNVTLKVVIEQSCEKSDTAFETQHILCGLDATVVSDNEPVNAAHWRQEMTAFRPDVMFIVGWHAKTPRFFATETLWQKVPKVLIFDLPFQWTFRKFLAPVILRRYLKHFDGVFVPGHRAVRYAKWLGFQSEEIYTGLFSICQKNAEPSKLRERRFLYVGRYAPEKRVDVLVAAYREYRKQVSEPWPLVCCGMGRDKKLFADVEGIEDLGFQQPEAVEKCFNTCGAFVLCSNFDPWPLVILESVSHGLPVICTAACGDSDELVKDNGIVCQTGDIHALAAAMVTIHSMSDEDRKTMGWKGPRLAEPYSCERWAERVVRIAAELSEKRGDR